MTELQPHYDVVVIGSGYGGSISASRMARAGRSVCLLERGREIRPGEYPQDVQEGRAEMQFLLPKGDDETIQLGNKTGMFDFHVNKDMTVLVGCGLGGTSLINANVSFVPDKRLFGLPDWPEVFRDQPDILDEWYQRALDMLGANPMPDDIELFKTAAHEASASAVGGRWYRLPINVNFDREGLNEQGVPQSKCTLCGDCVSGCNDGAKNTTLMNYLPDAMNHGAEIFCEAQVDRIEREGERWVVHFQHVGVGREHFGHETLFVTADLVFVAAGSLGSTEILLRSRRAGLPISDQLGQGFTGNGDVLGFAHRSDRVINGVSWKGRGAPQKVGPCITSVIDVRDPDDVTRSFIVEEGSPPGIVADLLPSVWNVAEAALEGRSMWERVLHTVQESIKWLRTLLFGHEGAELNHTQSFLAMAHDDGKGELYLARDRVRIRWPRVGRLPIFDVINDALDSASRALHARLLPNPIWSRLFEKRLISVHPLGGCAMGNDATDGVVDHCGRTFAGRSGTEVHAGLYVTDGAIVPRSLGVNPLITISALAERICHHAARDRGWTIDYASRRVAGPDQLPAQGLAIRFTEKMAGTVSTTQLDDFEAAAAHGRETNNRFEFTLTITGKLDAMVEDPSTRARLAGTVKAACLSSSALMVTAGTFQLFAPDPNDPTTKQMWYRMQLHGEDGRLFYFEGFKAVHDDQGFDAIADTTTLFIVVYEGPDADGPVIARGILNIAPRDFARQLSTMKVLHAKDQAERMAAKTRFVGMFAQQLWDTYGVV